MNSYFY